MLRNTIDLAAVLTLASICWANSAVGDDAKELKGDLKALQGTWNFTTGDGGKGTWVFKDDTLKLTLPNRSYKMKFKLDEAAKPAKTVDFKIEEGPDDAAGKTTLGIYKIDADALEVCIGAGEGARPEKFETDFGKSFTFKMTREKKE